MAVPYYGDYPEDHAKVIIPFNTFSSDDPSASVTVTDLADADIKVYKDGGDTEIGTDGATVSINFDTTTGNHLVTIDTSAHSDYATGSEYAVRLNGITVDAATLNVWIGSFSIERAGGVLALLKATLDVNVTSIAADVITPASVDEDADFTIQALSITNALDAGSVLVDGTTTLTGNVSCGAGFDVVGELSANSLLIDTTATVTGNALITGTTTHTGAVTLTNGINAGAISGTLAAGIITGTSLHADACTKIIDDFETQSAADPTGFKVNVKEINDTVTQLEMLMDKTTSINADADLTSIVVDKSVLSHAMTPAADTSTYKASTDSLEAIKVHADTIKAETVLILDDTDLIDDGTSGLAKIASDVDAILTDTDVIGALGVGLTAITDDTSQIGAAGVGLTEAGGDGDHLDEAGGDGDHLTESGGTGNQFTDITTPIATAQTDLDELTDAGTLSAVRLALMVDRIYTRLFHEVNVTDADGASAIRNAADNADIATGSITDDDTTTSQAAWSWV